jgi:UDP-glucose:(heptosyl)LPS alpha-1,3-glucosyltransferase
LGRGHDVDLIASSFGLDASGAKQIETPARGMTRLARLRHFQDDVDAYLNQKKYDIVHAMLPVHRCDIYHPHAGVAAEAIASGHEKYRHPLARQLAKAATRLNRKRGLTAEVESKLLAAKNPPIVLCLSEYVKQTVRTHYALPETKLATLFNAVALEKFDPQTRAGARIAQRNELGIDDLTTLGLMIAQDFHRKGLRELILAAGQLRNPRMKWVIVGKQDPAPYRQLAAQAGVKDQFIFAGPTRDPYVFYRAADFFVLPTRHDPCSLVVLEALAMGLPVISTKMNGACEIMRQGEHGYVLDDPGNIDALVQAMTMMSDPVRRGQISQACLLLRPQLSYEHHLDRLAAIYGKVTVPFPSGRGLG